MADALAFYERAMVEFSSRVHAVGAGQWGSPTPCSEWDVRTLVNHVTVEQLWAPELLAGRTVADVGDRFDGDQLGDDPVATWDSGSQTALAAFGADGALQRAVHLSYGDSPAEDYCWEMSTDLVVHAWDLARGIGADDGLPVDLVTEIHRRVEPQIAAWASSGMFAPPVPVPDDADPQTKLLGLLGRRR